MKINSLAGSPALPAMLANIPKLVTVYYTDVPDFSVPMQRVAFGTSGHRGYSFEKTFNEGYVLAISQAICLYRTQQGINGPLFLGIDTYALSVPTFVSALEVLAANGVKVMLAENDEYTPTPEVSYAILTYNRGRDQGLADGIVISPSHNPPDNGGFKYNPPNGGPADTGVTEDIYKIYVKSFRGEDHLRRILEEAQSIVSDALRRALEQDRGGVSAGLHQQAVSEAKEE